MIKHVAASFLFLVLAAADFSSPAKAADSPDNSTPPILTGIPLLPGIPVIPIPPDFPRFSMHLSRKTEGPVMTAFSNVNRKIFLVFRGRPLHPGDKIRACWFVEDGGRKMPKNYKACESVLKARMPVTDGVSYIVRPAVGWPPGAYRVEVYVNDLPVTSMKFSVG